MAEKSSQTADSRRHFRIVGMDCAEEVAVLKREVGPVVGGTQHLAFDILRGRMSVSSQAAETPARHIVEAVARTGMRAHLWREGPRADGSHFGWERWGRVVLTSLSGGAVLAAIGLHWSRHSLVAAFTADVATIPWLSRVLYIAAIIAGAWTVAPKAWIALRRLRPDMNLLMMVAVAGAVGIDEWLEGAMVAFLFALSLLLESWSISRARRAISALMKLVPTTVRMRLPDGGEHDVLPEQVEPGALFIVRPGERIALDGDVIEGTSHVDQAPITGESQPVVRQPADSVFAGTINGDGALLVRSTKPADETTLAHIIRLVGEAHSRKAPSEQWVEKFARLYTPTVMALALSMLLVPPLVLGYPWADCVYRSLVLLVVACPCALVISTPVSIVSAVAAAARQGVLVKGGVFMEAPARLRAIAFDKTGTLTTGTPSVVEVVPLADHDERGLLERAAAIEANSEHPLARAIIEHAKRLGIESSAAEEFRVIQGKGAEANYEGMRFWLGSHRFLEERGQETPEVHQRLKGMSSAGRSVVAVGNEEHVCGLLALADEVRHTTPDVLYELRSLGIEHLIMLTGDNEPTARAIATRAGIDEVRAELLPQDKVAVIGQLVADYGSVAMVGDGVNDAPALARATVGVAMGAAGVDAAIETADIALMTDDLSQLPWLIRHSRRTLTTIRQNIAFSLAIKALFVGLTFAGAASLWMAIAADMGASLLVIFNGLRLLHPVGHYWLPASPKLVD